MAPTRSLNVVISGTAKPLGVATKQADGHMDRLGKSGAKMSKALALGFATAGAAAGGALVVGLKKSVDAARDAEASMAKVKTIVDNAGISFDKHAKEIDKVIQAHSKLTGFDDEDLSESFANMVRTTKDLNEAFKLNGLAADIARAKGTDLAGAQSLLARVYNGSFTGVKRLGIAIEPVTKAQDALKKSTEHATDEQVRAAKAADKTATSQKAIAELQKAFGGQAEAYGKTAAGAQERLGVAVENLQEKIGAKLLPIVADVTNKVATFVNEMESGTGAGGRFADRISEGFEKVKAVAVAVWPVLQTVARFAGEAFETVKAGITAAIPVVQQFAVDAFGRLKSIGEVVLPALVTAFETVKSAVVTAFDAVKGAVSAAVGFVRGWIDKHRDDLQAFANAWKNIATVVGVAVGALVMVVKAQIEHVLVPVMKVVLSVVKAVWPAIKKVIEGALQAIGGIINVFSGIFTGDFKRIWEGVKDIFAGQLKVILGLVRAAADGLLAAAKGLGGVLKDGVVAGLKGLAGLLKDAIVGAVKWVANNVPGLIAGAVKGIGSKIAGWLIPGGDGLGKKIGDGIGRSMAASIPQFGGGLMGARASMAPVAGIASRFGLGVSSGRRPGAITSSGNKSYHSTGEALDIAGTPSGMLGFFRYMKNTAGSKLAELIYTPGGAGIHNGASHTYTGQVAADHFDHVHVAIDSGAPGVGDGIGQIKNLWTAQGGSAGVSNMAAAIAMAESGGDPDAISPPNRDGSVDRGLWQINSIHGALSTTNRAGNARAAIRISSNGRNWNPWTVFKTGAYKKFLSGAGGGSSSGGSSGGSSKKTKGIKAPGPTSGAADGRPGERPLPGLTSADIRAGRDPEALFAPWSPKGIKGLPEDMRPGESVGPPTQEDFTLAAIARARLTPDTADDIREAGNLVALRKAAMDQALASGDPRDDASAIDAYLQAAEALDALKKNTDATASLADALKGVQDEMKRQTDFAQSVTATSNYQLTKSLSDLIGGHIVGYGVAGRRFTPGSGVEYAY